MDDLLKIFYDVHPCKMTMTRLFPMHPFLTPENVRKPYLMFSWHRERVHWERMG